MGGEGKSLVHELEDSTGKTAMTSKMISRFNIILLGLFVEIKKLILKFAQKF